MSARKLRNSWWVDFRFGRERHRVRSPDNSKRGAEAYEALLRQRLARGEALNRPPETTFEAFSERWMKTYVQTNNKPSEQKSKAYILRRHLLPWFGGLPLSQITSAKIEQFKTATLSDGLSPKSVNNFLIVLMKCLRTAVDWEMLDKCPKVKNLKAISQRLEFLAIDESRTLLEASAGTSWHDMILLALRTGMRLGEIFGLRWEDVDFSRRMITVQHSVVQGIEGSPKNHQRRHIPMTDEVCRTLFEERRGEGLVFRRQDGRPRAYHTAYKGLHRACDRAGLRRISWHVLRHTFASQLATKGVPLTAIKELLGHSTINMTMRYAHLAPSTLKDAVAVLEHSEINGTANYGQPVGNAALPVIGV